jgi:hypothetical protein
MAQYDLLLIQNILSGDTEFSEKYVNIAKGGLLSSLADRTPAVLSAGSNGFMLVRDDDEPTGLKWVAIAAGHTQGTDAGTTNQTFQINSGSSGPKLKNNSLTLEARNEADDAYANFRAKDATFDKVTVSAAPSVGTDLTNKTYVDGLLNTLDGNLIFKGNIKSVNGDITPSAFNSLSTYNTGWQYRVAEEGMYKGFICEIGDMLTAIVTRGGTGALNEDWTVTQTNIDGAVTGPVSSVDNNIATYNGITGKLIKDSGITIGSIATAQSTADNAIPKSSLSAHSIVYSVNAATPLTLSVGVSTFIGRKATGDISAMTAAEARTVLNVADGANNYSHPNHSGDVTSVGSGAQTIVNSAVTLAKMANVATGTIFYRKSGGAGAPEVQTLATLKIDLGDMPILWSNVPATKTSGGLAGQVARDNNYLYICTATNVWKRSAIATNW